MLSVVEYNTGKILGINTEYMEDE